MAYGQYAAGGGLNRTKADMIAIFEERGFQVLQARKGGKNRLQFMDAAGHWNFTLHETVVATLTADRRTLTLADGGWPTMTTRTAWGDAVKAFGLRWASVTDRFSDGEAYTYERPSYPTKVERSVRYTVEAGTITGREAVPADHPMIRASVEDGNFAVRYIDGKFLESEAGASIKAPPFRVLTVLYRIDALAKATRTYHAFRGQALCQFQFKAFGLDIHPGQSSRTIMIGCHTFKTQEIRGVLRQLEGLYPVEAKRAKAFVRKHPLDYGVPAYEAAQRARYARAA